MDVIAFVDDFQAGIEALEEGGVSRHAHSGRGHAVSGKALQVVAVRLSANAAVVRGRAKRAGHALAGYAPRAETDQPGRNPTDLLVLERGRQSPDHI